MTFYNCILDSNNQFFSKPYYVDNINEKNPT